MSNFQKFGLICGSLLMGMALWQFILSQSAASAGLPVEVTYHFQLTAIFLIPGAGFLFFSWPSAEEAEKLWDALEEWFHSPKKSSALPWGKLLWFIPTALCASWFMNWQGIASWAAGAFALYTTLTKVLVPFGQALWRRADQADQKLLREEFPQLAE